MITFTPEIISQIIETVYGQHARELADERPNWAHLTEAERAAYSGRIYAWIASFRIGNRVEQVFTDREAALVWETTEQILGRDWTWMTGQGIRLERLSDEVMANAGALLDAWRNPPKEPDGAGLQESIPTSEGEAGGQAGGDEGSDSARSLQQDRSANSRLNRKSSRKLESVSGNS